MVLNAEQTVAIANVTDLENGNQCDSICGWFDFTVLAMADDYLFFTVFEFIKDFAQNTMVEITHVALVFAFHLPWQLLVLVDPSVLSELGP